MTRGGLSWWKDWVTLARKVVMFEETSAVFAWKVMLYTRTGVVEQWQGHETQKLDPNN